MGEESGEEEAAGVGSDGNDCCGTYMRWSLGVKLRLDGAMSDRTRARSADTARLARWSVTSII